MTLVGVLFKWRKQNCRAAALGWAPGPRLTLTMWLSIVLFLGWLLVHSDLGVRVEVPVRITEPTYMEPGRHDLDPNLYVPLPPYNFSYIINNEAICDLDHLELVIFAYTAPTDVLQRRTIRETWGSRALLDSLHIRLVFPLGLASSEEVARQVSLESQLYGDIVQGGFLDAYHNLSYKGVMMFRWTSTYCTKAKFLIKVDSDVFVNIAAVVPFLKTNYDNERRFFGCKVYWRSAVMRPGGWCGKWCVDNREYRARVYPPYCWGSVYVVSADLVTLLAQAASRVPIWWIADVYLTGILPRALGKVKHVVLRDYLEEDTDYLLERLEHHPAAVLFGFIRGTYDVHRSWTTINRFQTVIQDKDSSLRYDSSVLQPGILIQKLALPPNKPLTLSDGSVNKVNKSEFSTKRYSNKMQASIT